MSKAKKLEEQILTLLSSEHEVSIRSIARAAGLSENNDTDRKTVRRAIKSLEDQGLLAPKGEGRSRVYVAAIQSAAVTAEKKKSLTHERIVFHTEPGAFKDIELREESQELLRYVSQAETARTPVGYNQDFLHSYQPNITFYLSNERREQLHKLGLVETQTRPAGTYARNILNRLLIDLSWNSSRLEGNTYTMLETKRLIELGEAAQGKDATEAQMILNHKDAIEFVVENAAADELTPLDVRSIHALLSENLLGDPSASGRIRQLAVGIGGTTYMPLENPHILEDCFKMIVEKFNEIEDEFEQSLFALVHLSYLQAFEDVNKRTARLVANVPLIKSNLKPLSFTDLNKEAYVKSLIGVYEKNDVSLIADLYMWAYTRSSQRYTAIQQSLGEPNLLKLRHRQLIGDIVREIILEKTEGALVVQKIQNLIENKKAPEEDRDELFKLIETEILSLHEGNVARFKIRPSEYQAWKDVQ